MVSFSINILALLANSNTDYHQKLTSHKLIFRDMDADCLIHTAIQQGLAGLFYKNFLKSNTLDSLDIKHQEKLKASYYNTLRFNLSLIHDLNKILETANQQYIKMVLLQGISLLHHVYDDLTIRFGFSDGVDHLVYPLHTPFAVGKCSVLFKVGTCR